MLLLFGKATGMLGKSQRRAQLRKCRTDICFGVCWPFPLLCQAGNRHPNTTAIAAQRRQQPQGYFKAYLNPYAPRFHRFRPKWERHQKVQIRINPVFRNVSYQRNHTSKKEDNVSLYEYTGRSLHSIKLPKSRQWLNSGTEDLEAQPFIILFLQLSKISHSNSATPWAGLQVGISLEVEGRIPAGSSTPDTTYNAFIQYCRKLTLQSWWNTSLRHPAS